MDDLNKYLKTIVQEGYSFGTGIASYRNPNVKMLLNEFGEYVPKQVGDSQFAQDILPVCPNGDSSPNEDYVSKELYGNIPGIKFDKKVGYYSELYAGYVIEDDYRQNASSGGFGTWILKELLEQKLIDGVIHVKGTRDSEDGILFKYDISRTIAEIKAGAKTKYYPVELSEVLKAIKEKPGRYAIVGIPSFIFAIRLLALEDPIINERIKYTIGLICGHQKSAKFAECLAWQAGIMPGKLKMIDFRKKMEGQHSHSYGVELKGIVGGKEVTIVREMKSLIGNDWGQGFFKSEASDYTDDVMNETADITLGDAWLPQYTQDSGGNNVIIVRHPVMGKLIKKAEEEGRVKVDYLRVEDIIQSQSAHFQHTQADLPYRLYKKQTAGLWHPQKRVSPSSHISFWRRKIQDMRLEISRQSHIVYNQAVKRNDLKYFVDTMSKYSLKYKRLYFYKNLVDKGLWWILKRGTVKVFKKIKATIS